jgi:hypothetical protein
MFRKLVFAFLLAVLLSQFTIPAALAAGEPVGSCPPGFTLELAMDHDAHHHMHVGTDTDRNGDGYICMMHVTPTDKIHVHTDNNLP